MTQPHHQKEQDMAKAAFPMKQFDIKTVQTEAQKRAQQALHAGVGVTDFVVEVVRDYAAGTQKRVADVRNSVVAFEPRAFGVEAVKTVNGQVLAVPARVQQVVDINVTAATDTYSDLVKRGKSLVGRISRQQSTRDTVAAAATTATKAKTTRTQATTAAKSGTTAAKKTAKKSTTAAKKRTASTRSSAKATSTAAKKTGSSASRALTDGAQKVGD